MSEARERILDRLRRSHRLPSPELERPVERCDWDPEERFARFTRCMEAVRAEVHRTSEADWPDRLLTLCAAKGVGRLLIAPDTAHGRRLAEAAGEGGPELLAYEAEVEDWKDRLFDGVDAAFTGTRGAVAETGSLILWPDESEPRLMSLVPPIHFALLQADRILGTFAEAVEAQGWAAGMPANALLISGPSKSADIEQTLAYGVHGPKELVVLVVG